MLLIPQSQAQPRSVQPAAPVKADTSWIRPKALWLPTADYPVDVVGSAHAGSQGQHSSMASGRFGRCVLNTYVPNTGASGYFTAPGAVNMVGLAEVTLFAVVEFTDAATTGESGIIRCDQNDNTSNASYALDVFANTKKVRPLLATTGVSGWVTGNDVTRNEIAANVPLVFITRYQNISGRQFMDVSVVPVGQRAAWSHAGTVTGTVTQTSGNAADMQTHIGGMANTAGFNFPGLIYMAGVLPYYIDDAAANRLSMHPWQAFVPEDDFLFVPMPSSSGSGTAPGSLPSITLSAPTASASASSIATGAPASIPLSAPTATAHGSALAAGSVASVSLGAPTGSASASGTGVAVGALAAVSLSAPYGSASASSVAAGAPASITFGAPGASASSSGVVSASVASITLSAPTGTASSSGAGVATGTLAYLWLTAPAGTASASSLASGGVAAVSLSAPAGAAASSVMTLTSDDITAIVDAIWARAAIVPLPVDLTAIANAVWNRLTDTTYTSGDLLRLIAAMAAGRVSGAQTGTEVFRDVGNTKNRITATVDAKGNRTSINLDPT